MPHSLAASEDRAGPRQWARASVFALALIGAGDASAGDFNAEPPNAPNQRPAFTGQTRAPVITDGEPIPTVFAQNLVHPWGMAELPDGSWLVTERPGRMRLIDPKGKLGAPISGLPPIHAEGQGGLLDVAVRPDFAKTRRVWWSFAEPRGNGASATAVATGTLSRDARTLNEVRVIFHQQPAWRSDYHYGSRLVFDRQGALFVTTGERGLPQSRPLAQDVSTHLGKVLRIDPEGGAASGNPLIEGGQPEIWSYGHRNVQGAALAPDGSLWTVEHGPRGGDELNHPVAGRNYGWPVITYGIDYSGRPIGEGLTQNAGMEQPIYYWDPVIAPGGMTFYQGEMFAHWKDSLLIGGLASQALVRLSLQDGRVTGEARYFVGRDRIRDVAVAQDGAVMVLTDAENGQMIRLTPAR